MSGPIQTIPQGLLGLLQLKQMGRNPAELLETVQSTVELVPLWLKRQEVNLNPAGSTGQYGTPTATPGFFTFTTNPFTVPQSVTWWVSSFTIDCNLLAAETIRFAPLVNLPGNLNFTVGPDASDVITARARVLAASASSGFWLVPGAKLGIAVYDVLTAGTITIFGQATGVVVPI